ncbi:hypothetical protein BSKO_06203 [Bryopsis sp. KO-2023]|nr:hypothetical protein BSKO_06203 [Bryopsis sp. KO-2023]
MCSFAPMAGTSIVSHRNASGAKWQQGASKAVENSFDFLSKRALKGPERCTLEILVEVTLLVSGFIIGPGGVSIRAIQTITGTAIRSWSQPLPSRNGKKVRVFTIEGPLNAKCLALEFMKAAIIRYKYLAEGACWGESAQQRQTIEGVDFYYSPPPKSAAPRAAGLKAFPSQWVDIR